MNGLKSVAHVCIKTPDLARTLDFYGGALGMERLFDFTRRGRMIGFYLKLAERSFVEVFETAGEVVAPGADAALHGAQRAARAAGSGGGGELVKIRKMPETHAARGIVLPRRGAILVICAPPMGDKSPKATQKANSQKNKKNDAAAKSAAAKKAVAAPAKKGK